MSMRGNRGEKGVGQVIPVAESLERRELLSATIDPNSQVFRFHDAVNTPVEVRLEGPGSGAITLANNVPTGANISAITLSGTNAQSALVISVDGSSTSVGEITIDGDIHNLWLRKVELTGNGVLVEGSLGSITLLSMTSSATASVAGAVGQLAVRKLSQANVITARSFPKYVVIEGHNVRTATMATNFQAATDVGSLASSGSQSGPSSTSPSGSQDDSEPATIVVDHDPVYGNSSDTTLTGQVNGVDPSQYEIAVVIQAPDGTYVSKPYLNDPVTAINSDGTFSCAIVTGGVDQFSSNVLIYLLPKSVTAPAFNGATSIPVAITANAVAEDDVNRNPLNASEPGLIDGPGTPTIAFTHVPTLGSWGDDLTGVVQHVDPSKDAVFVYIYVPGAGGWWGPKPLWAVPATAIQSNGTFNVDITTGGIDNTATWITALVLPINYAADDLSGSGSLPVDLSQNALAQTAIQRQ